MPPEANRKFQLETEETKEDGLDRNMQDHYLVKEVGAFFKPWKTESFQKQLRQIPPRCIGI